MIFIVAIGCTYVAAPTANAYPINCSYPTNRCGYFYGRNEPEPYDFVFACGLYDYNVGQLESDIINYTNGTIPANQMPPNCAPNLGKAQYEAGGAYVILTMLGYPAGTSKSVAQQPAVQAEWLKRVNYYNSQGWIDYHYTLPNNFDGCRNTAYQIASPDIATVNDCQNGLQAIKFEDPADPSHHYVIKQQCGNPIGDLSALNPVPPVLSWDLVLSASASIATALAGRSTNATFNFTVHNNGPDTASYPENVNYYHPTAGTLAATLNSGNRITAIAATYTWSDTITIPNTAAINDEYCQLIHVDDATGPSTGGRDSSEVCVKVIAPPCVGNVTPGLDPWQPGVTSNVTLSFPAYQAASQTLTYSATGPGGYSLSGGPVTVAKGVGTYVIGPPSNPITPTQAGVYNFTWKPSAASNSCSGSITIVDIPYFAVYNGNVSAGGDFSPGCQSGSGGAGGVLAGWFDNQAAIAGANTSLSAIALGQITGFGSTHTGTIAPNMPPIGSTFANAGAGSGSVTSSATLPNLGGDFGGEKCFYTPTQPANTLANISNPGTVGVAPLDNGPHSYKASVAGNLTLNGGSINPGKDVALYVTGDVYITPGATGGIVYNGAGGGWTVNSNDTTTVPSFVLVVTGGNIYIDPHVTELDGTYIAEKDNLGKGGTIFTCGYDTGGHNYASWPASSMYSNCNNQLLVDGSFIADQVDLQRTYGTLQDANKTESPDSISRVCTNGPTASPVCAADFFNAGPETYLSSPAVAAPNGGAIYYNAITSLPPVL